jgi:hypothetical protein
MKKKWKPKVGDRVEITAIPFQGRIGVLERKRYVMFVPLWVVRCDGVDLLGRTTVNVSKHGMKQTTLVKG